MFNIYIVIHISTNVCRSAGKHILRSQINVYETMNEEIAPNVFFNPSLDSSHSIQLKCKIHEILLG